MINVKFLTAISNSSSLISSRLFKDSKNPILLSDKDLIKEKFLAERPRL